MRYRVSGLRIPHPDPDESVTVRALARALAVRIEGISDLRVLRRATDARRGVRHVCSVFTLEVDLRDRPGRFPPGLRLEEIGPPAPSRLKGSRAAGLRVVVVGSGPAGLFAAITLTKEGARVTLIEQGPSLRQRVGAIAGLWARGILDPRANVQFGAGGAGTFSDGKLTHRTRDPLARSVLQTFVDFGAPERILRDAHPYLGTDGARKVIAQMLGFLQESGVQIVFGTRAAVPKPEGRGWLVEAGGASLSADMVFLAAGHSARDLLRALAAAGVPFRSKGFAVGVRAEHPQEWLDACQYRGRPGTLGLPPADYRLSFQDAATGKAVYSFCPCPGGMVVNAASEEGGVVTNGMSLSAKASGWGNAGIVVEVSAGDLHPDPMAGITFQESLEREAFRMGGGTYAAPAQTAGAFLAGCMDASLPRSTYRPALRAARLGDLFPPFVAAPLGRALRDFDRKIPGFVERGLLIAPETRTSCPVQVVRAEDGSAEGFPRLYLIGEGSGWSGGIVSSAVDSLRICEGAMG